MEKNFNKWNEEKKNLDLKEEVEKYPKPREIWFVKM
jgi:hypothetical protein